MKCVYEDGYCDAAYMPPPEDPEGKLVWAILAVIISLSIIQLTTW